MTIRAGLAACALTLAVPVLAQPQAPAAPAPVQAPSQPVFRAGVELVRLDVRVLDDKGLPVRDLRQDEIRVLEQGVERPVVFFQHVAEPVGSYLDVARSTIGSEVSTNQGAPRGHLYVLVFDQNHITAGNEMRARQAADRLLRTRVKPGDRVALFALPGPGPQLRFTSNVNMVAAELPAVRGALDREGFGVAGTLTQHEAFEITRGNLGVLQTVLNRAAETGASAVDVPTRVAAGATAPPPAATDATSPSVMAVKENAKTIVERADTEAHTFLVRLADVIRELASIEGRKDVILVSEGFFADNLAADVERVAAAAAESYAVVNALDINRRSMDINAAAPVGASQGAEIQGRLEPLGTLAVETSGQLAIDAGSHIDQVLNQITDASQDYYIVGFEPPAGALVDRDKYRRVSVRVTRRGATAATRTGYALRESVNPADRRRSIDAALTAPFPQQGLPLAMTTYVLRGASPGVQRVVMSLQADLPVAGTRGGKAADVVFVVRDARDGRVMTSGSDVLPLPRTAAPGRSTARGQFRVQFDLPSGDYLMRTAVREPGGATGTVDRRFEVRRLDGVDVTASDLVIGRRSDPLPVRARGYVEEGIVGALEVYARNPVDLESVDVTIDLIPVDGETPVESMKADLLDIKALATGAGRPAQVAIPLSGVAPGDYVVRATLRSRGEAVTELMRQLEVVAGSAPPEPALAPEVVTPSMILAGDLARRFVATLGASQAGSDVKAAADQAAVGQWQKALAQLGNPAGDRPAAFHALRGLALFAAERRDEAANSLEKAFALDPASAPTAFFLGWVRSMSGKDQEALTAWRNATLKDPGLVPAYLALADTYTRLGHKDLAVQVLRDGLRLNPNSPELRSRAALADRK